MAGRGAIFLVIVALILVTQTPILSGPPDRAVLGGGGTVAENATATPVSSQGAGDVTGQSSSSEIPLRNHSETKLNSVKAAATGFFAGLPANRSDRRRIVARLANWSCSELQPINASVLKGAADAKREAYRLRHITKVAQKMEVRFSSVISPKQFREIAATAGTAGQFAPIVANYNHYYEAACAFNRSNPETVSDYYLASASLGVEIVMVQQQMYYKTSFVAARKVAHTRPFHVLQSVGGNKLAGLVLSEVHWFVRGSLGGVTSWVTQQADELALNLTVNESMVDGWRKEISRLFADGADVAVNKTKAGVNATKAIADCTKDTLAGENTSDEGVIGGITDAVGGLADKIEDINVSNISAPDLSDIEVPEVNASDIHGTVGGVDLSKLPKEAKEKIAACVNDK